MRILLKMKRTFMSALRIPQYECPTLSIIQRNSGHKFQNAANDNSLFCKAKTKPQQSRGDLRLESNGNVFSGFIFTLYAANKRRQDVDTGESAERVPATEILRIDKTLAMKCVRSFTRKICALIKQFKKAPNVASNQIKQTKLST